MSSIRFLVKILSLLTIIIILGCDSQDIEETDNNHFNSNWEIITTEFIDYCASDVSVGFSIFEKSNYIVVAYYDVNHQLSIGLRDPNGYWVFSKLDEYIDYDNHKYISLAIDNDGIVHVCANMHASPLVYYKGQNPYSILDLIKCSMTGISESTCTYPQFIIESSKLIFHYRNGVSGNGTEIFNEYNYDTKKWERLLDTPLFDGQGQCSAYFVGPTLGLDNLYHITWCWRDNPDCATNHGLYYAYSQDLKHWYNINNEVKVIPLLPTDKQFIVDDIPAGGGLLNIGFSLGFDNESNPLIGYHKYDENDKTNIFVAYINKKENKNWIKTKLTDWDWKWDFHGHGSIITELYIPKIWAIENNIYCQYMKINYPSQLISYDKQSGRCSTIEYHEYPKSLDIKKLENSDVVHIVFDSNSKDTKTKYLIRYETVNTNRDIQSDIHISPSPLILYKINR